MQFCKYIDGLVQERRSANAVLSHWSYVFLALSHRYNVPALYAMMDGESSISITEMHITSFP